MVVKKNVDRINNNVLDNKIMLMYCRGHKLSDSNLSSTLRVSQKISV